MSHRQMFEFTDQLLRSVEKTCAKYNGAARWNILYQFPEVNVSTCLYCNAKNLLSKPIVIQFIMLQKMEEA